MLFLASNGYRCIAHDRRGHGRSSQPCGPRHGYLRRRLGRGGQRAGSDRCRACRPLDGRRGSGQIYRARHGTNRAGSSVSQGLRDAFWMQGMQASIKAVLDCVKAFSETDQTEDLRAIDVPTLIIHGDDDQMVPIGASSLAAAKLVVGATLRVYPAHLMVCVPPTRHRSTTTFWRSCDRRPRQGNCSGATGTAPLALTERSLCRCGDSGVG